MRCTTILAAIVLTATAASAQPRMAVDQTDHDFGKTFQNQQLTHLFPFVNAGTELNTILNAGLSIKSDSLHTLASPPVRVLTPRPALLPPPGK